MLTGENSTGSVAAGWACTMLAKTQQGNALIRDQRALDGAKKMVHACAAARPLALTHPACEVCLITATVLLCGCRRC